MVKVDLIDIITQLVEDEQFPRIPVEIIDNHLPKIYANSNKGIVSIIIVLSYQYQSCHWRIICYEIYFRVTLGNTLKFYDRLCHWREFYRIL